MTASWELEELYPHAVNAVRDGGKASAAFLQRKLQVGYNSAAALIERMEHEGLVTSANHAGVREVIKPAPVDLDTGKPVAQQSSGLQGIEPIPETTTAPPPPRPEPTGPLQTFTCSGCDATTKAAGDMPTGWYTQTSGKLGTLLRCPACAEKNATRIATEHLTTEQILNGDSINGNDVITGAAQGRLRTIIERCERLREDLAVISADLKEVLAEAKGEGFDVKIIRKVLIARAKDKVVREEEEALFDLYMSALGG